MKKKDKERSETTQRFKPQHENSLQLRPPLPAPWTTPGAIQRVLGSGVKREASLSTADSSPQPASPDFWKVSFSH